MKRTFCFTLIELLVVIAIIAILAAMLFPAIGKVKALGTTMTCLNNQKQYGVSNITYANDFDILPHAQEHIKIMVFESKLPYTTIRCPVLKNGWGIRALKLKGQTPWRDGHDNHNYYWQNTDFGINTLLSRDSDPRKGSTLTGGALHYHRIYRPGFKLMICDTQWESSLKPPETLYGGWSASRYMRVRHEGSKVFPMIYADGHGARIDTGVFHPKENGTITSEKFFGGKFTDIKKGGVGRIYSGKLRYP